MTFQSRAQVRDSFFERIQARAHSKVLQIAHECSKPRDLLGRIEEYLVDNLHMICLGGVVVPMYPQKQRPSIYSCREMTGPGVGKPVVGRAASTGEDSAEVIQYDGAVASALGRGLVLGLATRGALPLGGEEGEIDVIVQRHPVHVSEFPW